MNRYILSVLVENRSGVLSKVSGLFSRRGYNIDSLTVGVTENLDVSRITIVVSGDEAIIEQINKQLNKLVDVIKIVQLSMDEAIYREIALIKIRIGKNRTNIIEVVNVFRASIIEMTRDIAIIEITGTEDKISNFIEIISPYGIKEMVRTGLTALEKGNKSI
ncbi:MAG TPA: acetolactate synthase small subunit [Clostridiaceae bacterium]